MATREAVARADALLLEHLSPEQRDDYERTRSFLVVTPGGRRYRLHGDRVNYQADLLAPDSEYVLAQYCVRPAEDGVPRADSLLAQMLLLEGDEAGFLLTANEVLFVPHLHRYLNGELKPPTPRHEPSIAEYRDTHATVIAGTGAQVVFASTPTLAQRIRESERCAVHDERSSSQRHAADGRGLDLYYPCGCPPRYVSFRQFDERQRSLQARAAGHLIGQRIAAGATDPITAAFRDGATRLIENANAFNAHIQAPMTEETLRFFADAPNARIEPIIR